jgi:hypothetical protein
LAAKQVEVAKKHHFVAKLQLGLMLCLSFHAQNASFASFAAAAEQFFLAILHDFSTMAS